MAESPVRLIWSLADSGLGTTLTATGNSGAYTATGNIKSAIDIRYVDDLEVLVYVAGTVTGTTPSLTVQFGFFDDQGNLFQPTTLKTTAITAASTPATAQALAAGRHAGSAGTYFTFSEWAQVAWTITGTNPVFNGVEIALYGRG
jgi:hypothetical protein